MYNNPTQNKRTKSASVNKFRKSTINACLTHNETHTTQTTQTAFNKTNTETFRLHNNRQTNTIQTKTPRSPPDKDVSPRLRPTCHPENYSATQKMTLLPRKLPCYPENYAVTKKITLLPRKCPCYPENSPTHEIVALASKNAQLSRK